MTKHIIWDLDGTLVDSETEIVQHLYKSIEKAGIKPYQKKADFKIGPPIDIVIRNAYNSVSDTQLKQIIQDFRLSYDNCGFKITQAYQGILKLLQELQGIKHHIVTNKPSLATTNLVAKLNWQNKFASISSPYMIGNKYSTKQELMNNVLKEFNIDISCIIAIGDSASDASAAQLNSIYAIGVTWGSGLIEELEPVCNTIVSTIDELRQTLIKLNYLQL